MRRGICSIYNIAIVVYIAIVIVIVIVIVNNYS
jgi:hypothetical protein